MSKNKVLVVDDDESIRELFTILLQQQFEVYQAKSGYEALESLKELRPDIILLDINMDGMDGYETCLEIRKTPNVSDVPVLFVSALDNEESRMKGYEVGADDYIIKSLVDQSIVDKLNKCLQKRNDLKEEQQKSKNAMNVAMEAMVVSSELGKVVDFVKQVAALKSVSAVGDQIVSVCKEFGLDACVHIKNSQECFVSCEPDSLEAKILFEVPNTAPKIISKGIRLILHCPNIVILIKNLPVEDENKVGRFRDHLALLLDIADARLANIKAMLNEELQRQEIILKLIEITEEQIKQTEVDIDNFITSSRSAVDGILMELDSLVFKLGLDDDQEKALMQLADNVSSQIVISAEKNEDFKQNLSGIVKKLKTLYNQN